MSSRMASTADDFESDPQPRFKVFIVPDAEVFLHVVQADAGVCGEIELLKLVRQCLDGGDSLGVQLVPVEVDDDERLGLRDGLRDPADLIVGGADLAETRHVLDLGKETRRLIS